MIEGVPRLLTVAETADFLRVSPKTVRRLIDAGLLQAVRLVSAASGRITPQSRLRVSGDSLSAYLGISPSRSKRTSTAYRRRVSVAMARLGFSPPDEHAGPEPGRTAAPCSD